MSGIKNVTCGHNSFLTGRHWTSFALCILIALLSTTQAQARLVKYDDFSGKELDGMKWAGVHTDFDLGGTGIALDTQRRVANGKLWMEMRAVGRSLSDFGARFIENALYFAHPERLTEISFKINVPEFEATGCPAGGSSFALARGFYSLFNDGTGDVMALIGLDRSSASTDPRRILQASAILLHRAQSGDSIIGFEALGEVRRKQTVVLRTRWSEMESLVEFQLNNDTPVIVPYTNVVASPPSIDFKSLSVSSVVSDCLSGPAPTAALEARIDDVFVNP